MKTDYIVEILPKFIKLGVVGMIGMGIDFLITWLFKDKAGINKYVVNTFGFSVAVVKDVRRY